MRNPLAILVSLLVLGGVINVFVSNPTISYETRKKMQIAGDAYMRGEQAKTVGEREDAFNLALKNYKELEDSFHPSFGNGILYFDIANTYFQLNQYPYALLYYYRASNLQPRNENLSSYIRLSQQKLGIKESDQPSMFHRFFFFLPALSIPEKLQLFSLFSIAAFLLFSVLIWYKKRWMKSIAFGTSFLSFALFAILIYNYYFSPVEAIAVHSVNLYRDAGFQYAKELDDPLLSGKKVKILEVLRNGKWLKILTAEGILGYVPSEAMRMI